MYEQTIGFDQCAKEDCSAIWFAKCEHGDFCHVHFLEHTNTDPDCNELWFHFLAQSVRLFAGFAEMTEKHFPLRLAPIVAFDRVREGFLLVLRNSYEAAGAPYGVGDDALWRWIEENERPNGPNT